MMSRRKSYGRRGNLSLAPLRSCDKLRALLVEIVELLTKHMEVLKAQYVGETIRALDSGQSDKFVALINDNEFWGSAGSILDVLLLGPGRDVDNPRLQQILGEVLSELIAKQLVGPTTLNGWS